MIRPKTRAVEGERAAGERNMREVFHLGCFLYRVEPCDTPILVPLLRPAQEVDQSIDEHVAAYLSVDINDAQNVSTRIEFEDAMLVPLTQVEMVTIVAEV